MTKKQKEERAAAEARKQALLASGVQIEALQDRGAPSAGKKVTYTDRKRGPKKGPAAEAASKEASPAPESPRIPEPALPPEPAAPVAKAVEPEPAEEKDEWDADSAEEGPAKAEGVKDDWEASSEEEAAKPAAPAKPADKGEHFNFFNLTYH